MIVAASYSTLADDMSRQNRLPMEFSLVYREGFDDTGPNSGQASSVLHTRWVVTGMKFLF